MNSNPKTLVLIAGDAGVGKTTLCKELFKRIKGSAWLDGDWCWMINPWINKTEEEKEYVCDTFARILKGYLENENTSVILFSWLIHTPWMFNLITDPLKDYDFNTVKIALVCDKESHIKRKIADNRRVELVYADTNMDKYYNLGAHVIDTTIRTVDETADLVMELIDKVNGSDS